MSIRFIMDGVHGELLLESAEMHCVSKRKYVSVELGVSEKGCMIVPFAKIKLYASDKFVDAEKTFADAKELGEAIAVAWNNRKEVQQRQVVLTIIANTRSDEGLKDLPELAKKVLKGQSETNNNS